MESKTVTLLVNREGELRVAPSEPLTFQEMAEALIVLELEYVDGTIRATLKKHRVKEVDSLSFFVA